mmetsp:Transcript_45731/g.99301  ORF Transcript_45731/g.99301 Transcript_45731/m.99301 type:complete len:232 (+) Transcript_45731:489-1184(+)
MPILVPSTRRICSSSIACSSSLTSTPCAARTLASSEPPIFRTRQSSDCTSSSFCTSIWALDTVRISLIFCPALPMINFTEDEGTTMMVCSGGGTLGLVSTVQSTERIPRNFPSMLPVISTNRSFSSNPSAADFTSMWAPLSLVSSLMVAPCFPTSHPPTSCVTKNRATDWDFWDGLMCSGTRSPQGLLSSLTALIPAAPPPPAPGNLKLAAVRLPLFTVSCNTACTRDTAS